MKEPHQARAEQARARAYELLGRALVRGVAGLSQAELGVLFGELTIDREQLAVEHHRVFELEVFPYAGVFLEPDARAGGEAARWMGDLYAAHGFPLPRDAPAADHLGVAFGFLAFAQGRGLGGQTLAAFIDRGLLSWMAPFVAAVARLDSPSWFGVVELGLGLVAAHRSEIPESAPCADRPPASGLVGANELGVAELAEALVAPVVSGVFLTRHELHGLARALELPRGFGSRAHTLENTLRAAGRFEKTQALLRAIDRTCEARLQALDDFAQTGGQASVTPWRAQTERTRAWLREQLV